MRSLCWAVALLASVAVAQEKKTEGKTKKSAAQEKKSSDIETAVKRLKSQPGFNIELFAGEPDMANPVAFCFDEKGRVYVIETYRFKTSTYDIRGYMKWVDDDLACRTVEDRNAMHRKWLGAKADKLDHAERIQLLEDSDGDGRADKATTFAKGFNTLAHGLAAGGLSRDGVFYYTCIPSLYRLVDKDGDGKADETKELHTGYGVRLAFLGHDLHGLIFGPDGKLYFSCGDRGFHVVTPDGRTVSNPDSGAVLRCNADGSELEILHIGLRNPQELAFDDQGNLFTGDNNADGGDKARWVYIAEGGDSGWRIGYQQMKSLGTWNKEGLWHLDAGKTAPSQVPPLAHIGHGPSGLAFHPGVAALPEKYKSHFFMCDFPGAVLAWTNQPKGAAFEPVGIHNFFGTSAGQMWMSDVGFGPDGKVYISDWLDGWDMKGRGRIFTTFDPQTIRDPLVAATRTLIADGFAQRGSDELIALLGHADRRVRQGAQFALAGKGSASIAALGSAAQSAANPLARLHAIWGLGQIGSTDAKAVEPLLPLLKDADLEVRASAAKVLGDRRAGAAFAGLVPLLKDPSLRVRYFAAQSLGKIGNKDAVAPIVDMLKADAGADAYLRNAGVVALAALNDFGSLARAARDESSAVRMASLLAMRRLHRPEIAMFLQDTDDAVLLEAARAINDEPVPAAFPALAGLLGRAKLPARVWPRAVNAAFRLGTPEQAAALTRVALRSDVANEVRVDALQCLAQWEKPSARDRLVGVWRPVAPRDAAPAKEALRVAAAILIGGSPDAVRTEAVKAASALGITDVTKDLIGLLKNAQIDPAVRAEALKALSMRKDVPVADAVEGALADPSPVLRTVAIRLLPKVAKGDAAARLEKLLVENEPVAVRQAAIAALAEVDGIEAEITLQKELDRAVAGKADPSLVLDVLEASAVKNTPAIKDRLAKFEAARPKDDPSAGWLESLEGGDAANGRAIFFERANAQCVRCHRVKLGGEVGPALESIAVQKTRKQLLESIVVPNKEIAKGFEQVVILTKDETTEVGRVEKESDAEVVLIQADGKRKVIAKSNIESRAVGKSAMPEDLIKVLSKRDIRDLVAFLSTLRDPVTPVGK